MAVTHQRWWMTCFRKCWRMFDRRRNIMRMGTTNMPIDVLDLMHQFHLFLTQFFAQLLQCDQFVFSFLVVLISALLFHCLQIVEFIFQRLIGGLNFASIIQFRIRFGENIYFCEICVNSRNCVFNGNYDYQYYANKNKLTQLICLNGIFNFVQGINRNHLARCSSSGPRLIISSAKQYRFESKTFQMTRQKVGKRCVWIMTKTKKNPIFKYWMLFTYFLLLSVCMYACM